ncbi:hypothetical protein Ahu01nite_073000 [Winogradskya humida]|uniref:Uncharacterized protein n=1 Tax=Winogradskya humida TaxID=113566 RepID=A0ABQ4A061_9ACTN|nr:hypothetical protein Ahu01nite_073000 [Actinoplanes humidus]
MEPGADRDEPGDAAAGRALSATVTAAKTARAGPAVTVLSFMGAPGVEADSRLAVGEQEHATPHKISKHLYL